MAQQIIIKGTPVTAANEVLVADSNSKIPAVDGSQVTAMSGTNVGTGTVATARLDTGTTANKIVILDGSARLPVVDGSLLTGIVAYTKSANDPTVTTNPSGGVGTEWVNHTSGKQFICTDATTNANVWRTSGGHSGDYLPNPLGSNAYTLGGTSYGFSCGGLKHTPTNSASNRIDRYAFASSSNSTDHADMVEKGKSGSGSQTATHGYMFSGTRGDSYSGPAAGFTDMIQKFAFASGNASDTTYNLTYGRRTSCEAAASTSYAFICGGDGVDGGAASGGYVDDSIERYSFVSEANTIDWANLTSYRNSGAVVSGGTHGYYAGGATGIRPYSGPSYARVNVIEYFPYASQTNAVDSGDLTVARSGGGMFSGPDYGYFVGGYSTAITNTIDKFSLTVVGANATDVGDLLNNSGTPSGALVGYTGGSTTSSTTHGYHIGGGGGVPIPTMIQRVSFASDGNATDVGELTQEGGGGRTEHPFGCWD